MSLVKLSNLFKISWALYLSNELSSSELLGLVKIPSSNSWQNLFRALNLSGSAQFSETSKSRELIDSSSICNCYKTW